MPFGRESWCLVLDSDFAGTQRRSDVVEAQRALLTNASASDAVSIPTNRNHTSGGIQGTREGSIPSPTAEHQSGAPLLNNDRVVQRRRAGRRSLDKYIDPRHHLPMPSMQRWDAGSDVVRSDGAPETRTGFVRLDLLGPNAGLFLLFGFGDGLTKSVRIGRSDELTPVRA